MPVFQWASESGITTLTTERLSIREFQASDWGAVHAYASDPEATRYMDWGPNTESDTSAFLQRVIGYQSSNPRTHFELAVTLKETGGLIGGCTIEVIHPVRREGDIGYCFNKAYWGKGYGTETAQSLLAFGFGQLALHKISAKCDPANTGSKKVLEKAGMTFEGRLRENLLIRGRWHDEMLYGILDHEWALRKGGGQRRFP